MMYSEVTLDLAMDDPSTCRVLRLGKESVVVESHVAYSATGKTYSQASEEVRKGWKNYAKYRGVESKLFVVNSEGIRDEDGTIGPLNDDFITKHTLFVFATETLFDKRFKSASVSSIYDILCTIVKEEDVKKLTVQSHSQAIVISDDE